MAKIVFKRAKSSKHPMTWRTVKFGNLMAYGVQAELSMNVEGPYEGEWTAWVFYDEPGRRDDFRIDFRSREAARRWAVKKLKQHGVG